MYLTSRQQRVDQRPAVVDGDVGAEREGEFLGIVEDPLIEPGFEAWRDVRDEVSQPGDVVPRHTLAPGAVRWFGNGEDAGLVAHVVLCNSERVSGEAARLGEDLLTAFVDSASSHRHRTGVERSLAKFDPRGIAFDDVDAIRLKAE